MSVRFGPSDAIGFSWRRFQEHAGEWIGVLIIYGIGIGVPLFIAAPFLLQDRAMPALIVLLVAMLLCVFLMVGVVQISLSAADRKAWTFGQLFQGRGFFRYLGAAILYTLAVAIGLVALIIPGYILIFRLSFFPYFIVDRGEGPVTALKSSWALTRGSFWDLFAYYQALTTLVYLSALPFGLGLFVTLPMFFIANAYVYRLMQKNPYKPTV